MCIWGGYVLLFLLSVIILTASGVSYAIIIHSQQTIPIFFFVSYVSYLLFNISQNLVTATCVVRLSGGISFKDLNISVCETSCVSSADELRPALLSLIRISQNTTSPFSKAVKNIWRKIYVFLGSTIQHIIIISTGTSRHNIALCLLKV